MARDPAKITEKMDDPGVHAEAAMAGALPQRLAYMKLFGSQYILPEDRTRRAPRPGSLDEDILPRIAPRMLLAPGY